jgi:predicted HTH transcriptional regulator
MIHDNSIKCYEEEAGNLSERQAEILRLFKQNPHNEYTDRQVMKHFWKEDPNWARPRITELITKEILRECGKTECKDTKKTVRLVKLAGNDNQLEMF